MAKVYDKVCIICDTAFTTKKSLTKTCSKKCMGKMLSGENNPNYGRKHTPEEKEKCRQAALNAWADPEHRKRIRKIRTQSKAVKDHLTKISLKRAKNPESFEQERRTNEKNGRWIPLEQQPDYILYIRQVSKYTRMVDVSSWENVDKIGKSGVDDAYQLDHIYSISDGFRNGVVPWIIGSIHNLRIIPWLDNNSKRGRSDIELEKLYERYESG